MPDAGLPWQEPRASPFRRTKRVLGFLRDGTGDLLAALREKGAQTGRGRRPERERSMKEITVRLPQPSEKQRQFLEERARYVGFGGARGGGKSHAVRMKALLLAAAHPGIRQMIMRRSYPELYANHIRPFLSLLPDGAYTYRDSRKEIVLPNGSVILFRFCGSDKDLRAYQGTETDVLYLDEATQFTEEQFRTLCACVRGTGDFPRRIYLTFNPGGVGHGWAKRLFVDRSFREGEEPDEYVFIRSLVTDNHALMRADPDYIKRLYALPPRLREAWLYGKWDLFEGQFFEELTDDPAHYADRVRTHIIDPFEIPPSWSIARSFDFGYARPFSCGWWAVDETGTAYRILELYGCTENPNEGVRWTPDRIFAEIARMEREHRWLRGKVHPGGCGSFHLGRLPRGIRCRHRRPARRILLAGRQRPSARLDAGAPAAGI